GIKLAVTANFAANLCFKSGQLMLLSDTLGSIKWQLLPFYGSSHRPPHASICRFWPTYASEWYRTLSRSSLQGRELAPAVGQLMLPIAANSWFKRHTTSHQKKAGDNRTSRQGDDIQGEPQAADV